MAVDLIFFSSSSFASIHSIRQALLLDDSVCMCVCECSLFAWMEWNKETKLFDNDDDGDCRNHFGTLREISWSISENI